MSEIKLLDCTLRDGGYVNDWHFGRNNMINIFERVVDAGIDIIEVGFLDQRRDFDIDRSIMPDTDCVGKIYGVLDKKHTNVVGMIDFGTCDLKNIKPRSESFLDGIRVIFKKHLRKEALEYCAELKKLGYDVFAQLVSVTSYNEQEMMDLIRLANEVKPYAVSIVDTYGLLHQDNLMHYFDLLNENLDVSIGLGYHAHNNFQMGYANCIAMLSNKIDRTLIVDGSIYGMGKSAGNAPLELIAMHMNQCHGKEYQISQILEAIDTSILEFYHPATWGYNMFYFLAASNDCHPTYVTYLMEKHTLSVKSINEILGRLEGDKKLMVDMDYIEQLYIDYQNNTVNDGEAYKKLENSIKQRKLLLLGPGVSVKNDEERIAQYIEQEKPIIVSINYIPDTIAPDAIFISNSKRYLQLATRLVEKPCKIIATSNVTATRDNAFDYVLNFSTLMDTSCKFVDNSLIMALKAIVKLGVDKVILAGFDGYSSQYSNYYNTVMEYDFVKDSADYLNKYTTEYIKNIKDVINVKFITKSRYNGDEI